MTDWTVRGGFPAIFLLVGCLEPDPVAVGEQAQFLGDGAGGFPSCGFGGGGAPIVPCKCVGTSNDLTIDSSNPNDGDVSDPTCWVDGSPEMSCLLRWDISAIPTNATVTGADLTVSVVDGSLANYSGQRIIRPWTEAGATWVNSKGSTTWATAGAKAATDRSPTTLFTFSGYSGVQITTLNSSGLAAVQGWVNSPISNQGVVISSADTHRMGISSKEGASAPRLCVSYTTP